jgi:hypothetical protein
MAPLQANLNRDITPEVVISEIKLGLPFMVLDLVYQSKMICLTGT